MGCRLWLWERMSSINLRHPGTIGRRVRVHIVGVTTLRINLLHRHGILDSGINRDEGIITRNTPALSLSEMARLAGFRNTR
jgi:hypothetical protein